MKLFLADASADAAQLLHDSIANHGYLVAALAAVLVLVPIVLKAFGKSLPFVDGLLEAAVGALKAFSKPKVVPVPTEPEKAAEPGVANVVDIKKLSDDK